MVRNQDKKNSDKTNILQETVSTLSVCFGLLSLLFSLHLVDQLVIDAGYRKSLDTRRHSKCLQRGKHQRNPATKQLPSRSYAAEGVWKWDAAKSSGLWTEVPRRRPQYLSPLSAKQLATGASFRKLLISHFLVKQRAGWTTDDMVWCR